MITGRVFDVSKGCVHDGPGLRTVVFLKGCALGCPWCHNVEGTKPKPELAHDPGRCISCGRCVEACPRNPGAWSLDGTNTWRDDCDVCGRCADACPSGARQLVGGDLGADELVRDVLADADFFAGTGGGVTFSGGEPLLQAEFVFECARRLGDKNVHVAVETAGFWPARHVAKLAEHVDLVLFDLKHTDRDKLRQVTGVEADTVLENLEALLAQDVELELSLTLVPGFNTGERDLDAIAGWLASRQRVPPLRLKPFHRLATGKAPLFGSAYGYARVEPLGAGELTNIASSLQARGISVLSSGPDDVLRSR